MFPVNHCSPFLHKLIRPSGEGIRSYITLVSLQCPAHRWMYRRVCGNSSWWVELLFHISSQVSANTKDIFFFCQRCLPRWASSYWLLWTPSQMVSQSVPRRWLMCGAPGDSGEGVKVMGRDRQGLPQPPLPHPSFPSYLFLLVSLNVIPDTCAQSPLPLSPFLSKLGAFSA